MLFDLDATSWLPDLNVVTLLSARSHEAKKKANVSSALRANARRRFRHASCIPVSGPAWRSCEFTLPQLLVELHLFVEIALELLAIDEILESSSELAKIGHSFESAH